MKAKKSIKVKQTKKSSDISVTKEMLFSARKELKHEMTSLRLEMTSGFKKTDAKIDVKISEVKFEVEKVKSEVEKVKSEVEKVKSEVEKVLAAVHRVGLLVEEQNARNIYVLDGHTNLHERLLRVEKKVSEEN